MRLYTSTRLSRAAILVVLSIALAALTSGLIPSRMPVTTAAAAQRPPQPPTFLPSGYIPPACQSMNRQDPYILDCWLNQFPDTIARWIEWEKRKGLLKSWTEWEEWRRRDLRRAFMHARQWYAGGMTVWRGTFVEDPPFNVASEDHPIGAGTDLDERTAAWPLYVAHVAFTMAAEIDAWVPWSIRTYIQRGGENGNSPLYHLLSPYWGWGFAGMFQRRPDKDYPQGRFEVMTATPTHPTIMFKFFKDNDLIGPTPTATIGRVLDWSRSNLRHYDGTLTMDNAEAHWRYRGLPPVSRILEGTNRILPNGTIDAVAKHWTAGCGGTSNLYTLLFRAVNVPVLRLFLPVVCNNHATVHFSAIDRYLSHGDDPYDAFSKARVTPGGPYYNAELLLIEPGKFNTWFNPTAATCPNVARRPIEIAANTYADSDAVVTRYCQDLLAGASHADGLVYNEIFKPFYSVTTLERKNLWGRLDATFPRTSPSPCNLLAQSARGAGEE